MRFGTPDAPLDTGGVSLSPSVALRSGGGNIGNVAGGDELQCLVDEFGEVQVYRHCKYCLSKRRQPFVQAEHSLKRIQQRMKGALAHVTADVERLCHVLTVGGTLPMPFMAVDEFVADVRLLQGLQEELIDPKGNARWEEALIVIQRHLHNMEAVGKCLHGIAIQATRKMATAASTMQGRGIRMCSRLFLRWRYGEARRLVSYWKENVQSDDAHQKGLKLMKRIGARFKNKGLALCFGEMYHNYKEDEGDAYGQLKLDHDELQLKFSMVTQAGAENIMRNVAKRILYGEVAQGIVAWRYNVMVDKNQERGEAIMRRVGGRWRNQELAEGFFGWCANKREEENQGRAEAILRRAGGRMRNKELFMSWDAWYRNYKDGITVMWLHRFQRQKLEYDELQLKFSMVTQAGAENIMRNVAKRILYGEVAQGIVAWRYNVMVDKNQERGEAIMRRVGGRWRNQELAEGFFGWCANKREEENQGRAEAILRRAGGRMRNKELFMSWDAWYRNYKDGIMDMWRSRWKSLQTKHDENIVRRVMSGIRLWCSAWDREWTILQRSMYHEWVKFVATKRRGHLRKRMLSRQRAAGARIMSMMMGSHDAILRKKYLILWAGLAHSSQIRRDGQALAHRESVKAEQALTDSLAEAHLVAVTKTAAVLVAAVYHERERFLRTKAFRYWHDPHTGGDRHGRVAPEPTSVTKAEVGHKLYHCRHDVHKLGEHSAKCGGMVEMTIKERKALSEQGGAVVCLLCAVHCGCGRPGCGEGAEGLHRVVDGEVRIDEKWCKEQRRWAAMEAEEMTHANEDGDIYHEDDSPSHRALDSSRMSSYGH